MATIYVSPTGSNTSPYDTWAKAATSLNTAINAATSDGDVIVCKNVTTHVFTITLTTLSASITIQNENGDDDYSGTVINVQGASSIKLLADGKTITFKGITFDGGDSVNYLHTGSSALFRVAAANDFKNCTLTLDHVRITRITADTSVSSRVAGILNLTGVTTAVQNTIVLKGCEVDNCWNDVGATGRDYMGTTINNNLKLVDCYFHDNGVPNTYKTGCIIVNQTINAFTPTWQVLGGRFMDTWGGLDAGDGGVFYFSNSASAGIKSSLYIEGTYWSGSSAKKGGAFWAGQNVDCDVVRSTFEDNTAFSYGGGAIGRGGNTYMATELGYSRIVSSVFRRNRAIEGGSGGAVFVVNVNGRIEIEHCEFENNYSTTSGNTLYSQDRAASATVQLPTLRNSRIYGDYSQGDGAHITGENDDGRWQLYDSIIEGGIKAIKDTSAHLENIYDANLDKYLRALRTVPGRAIGADFQSRTPTWANYDAAGTKWKTLPSIGRYQVLP